MNNQGYSNRFWKGICIVSAILVVTMFVLFYSVTARACLDHWSDMLNNKHSTMAKIF
jgi:hypothetical protein